MVAAKTKNETLKKSISALKFILPSVLAGGAMFIPVLGGFAIASTVAWQVSKILDGIKKIADDIDNLTISDYKSTMLLFKDILISIASDVDPDLDEIQAVYRKAIDGYVKLDMKRIPEKIELIKIQMFCIIYINCYDRDKNSLKPFDSVDEFHKRNIKAKITERLKDLQILSDSNYLEYYSENSFTSVNNLRYQTMLDAIDHIKKVSYGNIIIHDNMYQVDGVAVKIWSLNSLMIPVGENDALSSSLHIISRDDSIQASCYKDKQRNWFLVIHLPKREDYEDLTVICSYQVEENEAVIFLPWMIDEKTWKIDASFISERGTLTFLMCMSGEDLYSNNLVLEDFQPNGSFGFVRSLEKSQFIILQDYFQQGQVILEKKTYSVMTVISLMNLTDHAIPITSPVFESGCFSKSYPWPMKAPPMKMTNLVTRKMNLSTAGSVGITLLKLISDLHVLIYWSTPYDHNLYENCFGIGHYLVTDSTDYSSKLPSIIGGLPSQPPKDVNFELHLARNGPISKRLPNKWMISLKMTTDHKAALDLFILRH